MAPGGIGFAGCVSYGDQAGDSTEVATWSRVLPARKSNMDCKSVVAALSLVSGLYDVTTVLQDGACQGGRITAARDVRAVMPEGQPQPWQANDQLLPETPALP
jgi:hypothetical protein